MQIKMGAILKSLRMQRGYTQEQVAEAFGVSPQAVSRWETDAACPDTSLLPGLAVFFDTTTDALLGMDSLRSQQTLRDIHTDINRHVTAGRIDEAVALIRGALKTWPQDVGLLMSLGETLAHQNTPQAAAEAIAIAEGVLRRGDVSMKAKGTAAANLLFLYLRTGAKDKAAALVSALPHIWECREMLACEVCSDADYPAALRAGVRKALVYLYRRVTAAAEHRCGVTPGYVQLGVDFAPPVTDAKMLQTLADFLQQEATA